MLQVPLHRFLGLGRKRIVQITGDVIPNVFAFQDHCNGLFPGIAPSNDEASCLRIMMRGPCNRTFTVLAVIRTGSLGNVLRVCWVLHEGWDHHAYLLVTGPHQIMIPFDIASED